MTIRNIIPSRVLSERDGEFGKGMLLALPLPLSSSSFVRFFRYYGPIRLTFLFRRSSSKDLLPYSPNSYVTSPATEKTSKLREFILPLPVLTKTKSTPKPRAASTVSASDSLSSLKPPRPAMRSRTADSSFYFHPTASHSTSNHSEITQFSMSDDHLAFGQIDGPSTPLPSNGSATDQAFQELPPIQPLRSLHSTMGPQHSKLQPQSPAKPNGRRWSVRSEKIRPSPLGLGSASDRLRNGASGMRTVTVAEPREALLRGSVQVTIQRREPHDQV